MPDPTHDPLVQLSDALAARAATAAGLVACVHTTRARWRSVTLWRPDVAIGSEQVFPKQIEGAEICLADGRRIAARVAGRDPGTNILALRLETPLEIERPARADAVLGGLALAFGADAGGEPTVRLGLVRSLGPAWHSRAGGLIDRRVALDLKLSREEEGGPVLDAAGRRVGMSTGGPGGGALVIPAATIERILDPLLAAGHFERGWLGVALHPVALSGAASGEHGQDRGLMVLQVAPDGPAAKAGIAAGDILVAIDEAPAVRPAAIARRFGPDSIGREIELRFVRGGAPLTATATITARPAG